MQFLGPVTVYMYWNIINNNFKHNCVWVVVSNIVYFHPYLGKIPILTNIFQLGWNHQLGVV